MIFSNGVDHLQRRKLATGELDRLVHGEQVQLLAPLITSEHTVIPYRFYELPGNCLSPLMSISREVDSIRKRLKKRKPRDDTSFLNIVFGSESPAIAPYLIRVTQDQPCSALCQVILEENDMWYLRQLIQREYKARLSVYDHNVVSHAEYPVGFREELPGYERWTSKDGFVYGLYNHLHFKIFYDLDNFGGVQIQDVKVVPVSFKHTSTANANSQELTIVDTCNATSNPLVEEKDPDKHLLLPRKILMESKLQVFYSYQVQWIPSDRVLDEEDKSILIDYKVPLSVAIVLILVIAWFLRRGGQGLRQQFFRVQQKRSTGTVELRPLQQQEGQDLAKASSDSEETEASGEDFAWPQLPSRLCHLVGTGAQLLASVILTATLGMWPEKSPLVVRFLFFYACCGFLAGYVSARVQKLFGHGITFLFSTAFKTIWMSSIPSFVGLFVVLLRNAILNPFGGATSTDFRWILLLVLLQGFQALLVSVGTLRGNRTRTLQLATQGPVGVSDDIRSANKCSRLSKHCATALFVTMIILGGLIPILSLQANLVRLTRSLLRSGSTATNFFECTSLTLLFFTVLCSGSSIVVFCLHVRFFWKRGGWWICCYHGISVGVFAFLDMMWIIISRLHLMGPASQFILLVMVLFLSVSLVILCSFVGISSVLAILWSISDDRKHIATSRAPPL